MHQKLTISIILQIELLRATIETHRSLGPENRKLFDRDIATSVQVTAVSLFSPMDLRENDCEGSEEQSTKRKIPKYDFSEVTKKVVHIT